METAVTYAEAPPVRSPVDDSRPYAANRWTEVDVTAAVQGGQELTLAILAKNSTTLNLASRESEQPPELVVQVSAPLSALQTALQRWALVETD